jgi:hypothetical protein
MMILVQKIKIYMDLGRSGTTPYIFTFRLILTRFFPFGKGKMAHGLWPIVYGKSPLFKLMIASWIANGGFYVDRENKASPVSFLGKRKEIPRYLL